MDFWTIRRVNLFLSIPARTTLTPLLAPLGIILFAVRFLPAGPAHRPAASGREGAHAGGSMYIAGRRRGRHLGGMRSRRIRRVLWT